jgi:hypothetical protein
MELQEAVERSKELAFNTKWMGSFNFGSDRVMLEKDKRCMVAGKECTYKMYHDVKTDRMVIEFTEFEGNFLVSRMVYQPLKNRFAGRDRTTKSGVAQLVPEDNVEKWKYFGRPKYLLKMERKDTEKKIVPLLFREDVAAEYELPECDIAQLEPQCLDNKEFPAICLIACDRPDYFEQVVQALAQNPQFHKWPVYLFIDKPEAKERIRVVEEQLEFLAKYCDAYIIKRRENWGCGNNIIDARHQLFDKVGHDRVYVFEDDLVPAANYLTLCENMWEWSKQYSNVGVIQGWNWCELSPDAREGYIDYVTATMGNWWGYSMSKECWDSIKDMMYEYRDTFLFGQFYTDRPHRTILEWFRQFTAKRPESLGGVTYPDPDGFETTVMNYFSGPPTGQDAATMIATWYKGWRRVAPVVNRGKYIGKTGIHMTKKMWDRDGYANILFTEYPEDTERTEFVEKIQYLADIAIEPEEKMKGLKRVVLY